MNIDHIARAVRSMSDAELAVELARLERERRHASTMPGLRLIKVRIQMINAELASRRLRVPDTTTSPRQARWLPASTNFPANRDESGDDHTAVDADARGVVCAATPAGKQPLEITP